HDEEVRDIAFSPNGRDLAAISTSGDISLVDLNKENERKTWAGGIAGLGLAFSADSTRLATASGDYAVVWDVITAEKVHMFSHIDVPEKARGLVWVDDVTFSPDGKYLATAGRDNSARV